MEVKILHDRLHDDGACTVVVRSSTDPTRTVTFTKQEWAAFLAGVMNGEFGL